MDESGTNRCNQHSAAFQAVTGWLGLLLFLALLGGAIASPLLAADTNAVDVADLKAKAAQGSAHARFQLGCIYEQGKQVPRDYAAALQWYRQAADQNHALAQHNLALMLANGRGTPTNFTEALQWFRRAAEQGLAGSQYEVGNWLAKGRAAPRDLPEAARWLRKAADQGYALAQYGLAMMLADGEGVPKDVPGALSLFRQAGRQMFPPACDRLGVAYATGDGVPLDHRQALSWFTQAAMRGFPPSMYHLGLSHMQGNGVPKNLVAACTWFQLAANAGHAKARLALDTVARQLTPEEYLEAQRRAKAFVPLVDRAGAPAPPLVEPPEPTSATAFFVTDDGYALTAAHVVTRARKVTLRTGGRDLVADVVRVDAANDLALLKVKGKFTAVPLQSSREVRLGEAVFTVGFPNIALQGVEPKLTEGRISGLAGMQDDPRFFQTSVSIQPGNSGSALMNLKGNVVGVITRQLWILYEPSTLNPQLSTIPSTLPQNVNYAIKSAYALTLLDADPKLAKSLKRPGTKERPLEVLADKLRQSSALVLVEAQ